MAMGYAGGYNGFRPNQTTSFNPFQPGPETGPQLQARYGNTPETFNQLATINGWNTPQPGNTAAPPATPGSPAPPSTPGGAVTGGLSDILAQIEKVYAGQNDVAMREAQKSMGNRGLGRGDGAGNHIYNQLLSDVGASKSNAVMQAMMGQQGVDQATQRFNQQLELQRQQAQNEQSNWQRQFDAMQKQQQVTNVSGGRTDAAGNPISPQQAALLDAQQAQQAGPGAAVQSTMGPAAAAALAKIMGGSGGKTREELLGGDAGSAAGQPWSVPAGGMPGFGDGKPTTGPTAGLDSTGKWQKPGSYSRNTGAESSTWSPPGAQGSAFSPAAKTTGAMNGANSAINAAGSAPPGYYTGKR